MLGRIKKLYEARNSMVDVWGEGENAVVYMDGMCYACNGREDGITMLIQCYKEMLDEEEAIERLEELLEKFTELGVEMEYVEMECGKILAINGDNNAMFDDYFEVVGMLEDILKKLN